VSVVIARRATYHYQSLKPQLFEMLEHIGGGLIEKDSGKIVAKVLNRSF